MRPSGCRRLSPARSPAASARPGARPPPASGPRPATTAGRPPRGCHCATRAHPLFPSPSHPRTPRASPAAPVATVKAVRPAWCRAGRARRLTGVPSCRPHRPPQRSRRPVNRAAARSISSTARPGNSARSRSHASHRAAPALQSRTRTSASGWDPPRSSSARSFPRRPSRDPAAASAARSRAKAAPPANSPSRRNPATIHGLRLFHLPSRAAPPTNAPTRPRLPRARIAGPAHHTLQGTTGPASAGSDRRGSSPFH